MKVMIVEDDAALREIYGIRITAEGYTVVTAGDGEEALAVAVREKPDLILSDVMMPKISGFDMLDILRNTPETAKIKVVMMTALSSDDQRARGERLGADRYLVKSQVGIEDVINTIHEVLGDKTVPSEQPATLGQPITPEQSTAPRQSTVTSQPTTLGQPVSPVQPTTPEQPTSATASPPATATTMPITVTPMPVPATVEATNGINPAQ